MAITSTVPEHFPSLYQDEWRLELQQLTSRLSGLVPTYPVMGDSRRFNKLGKVESTAMTGRFQDSAPQDVATEMRSLYVDFRTVENFVSKVDSIRLGEIDSPHNAIIKSHMAAAGRDRDAAIIAMLGGSAYEGKNGTSEVVFNTAENSIAKTYDYAAVGANAGLSYDKIVNARTRLGGKNVAGQNVEGSSPLGMVITHDEVEDLLHDDKFINRDYRAKLEEAQSGSIVDAFGFTIIAVDATLLPAVTNTRACYAFAKDCVAFGYAEEPQTYVDVLPTKRHDTQIRSEWAWGGTRLDDSGVIQINVHRA
jgi:hypothetical protein